MTIIPPNAADLRGAVDLSSLVQRGTHQPSSPASGDVSQQHDSQTVPALVMDGTDTNFSQFLELSTHVPVLVDLWAEWCTPCKQLSPVLETLVREYKGRLVLVKIDVDANPQLAQAFQAQSIPAIAALIGGKPIQLFAGVLPEQQLRDVFDQVLQLAADNGVSKTVTVDSVNGDTSTDDTEVEPVPPLHQEALDAIERGDYSAAISAYNTAIANNPGDEVAVAARAQTRLLERLRDKSIEQIRSAVASDPHNLDAQLNVADLDVSGGHVDDAFDRLLNLFATGDIESQNMIRGRLLELFEVVGTTDPRVVAARKRLTMLLY
jgi:putative thioredoxin